MSVAGLVAGADRLLERADGLYPAAGAAGMLTGGGGHRAAPTVAGESSALGKGATTAREGYLRSQASASGLDQEFEQATTQGTLIAEQGRIGSGNILTQARAFAGSAALLGNTAAGAQLVVATMDQHLQAMQTQLHQTSTANEAVSSQLRAISTGYQTLAGGAKDAPATPLDTPRRPYIQGPPPPLIPPEPSPSPALPTPPPPLGLPAPMEDFLRYQLRGQVIPNPPAPHITAEEIRQHIINQDLEYRQFVAWFNKTYGGDISPGDLAARVAAFEGSTLGTLASVAGWPEAIPATFAGLFGMFASGWSLFTADPGIAQIPDPGPP